jgi:kynurenine formamidase
MKIRDLSMPVYEGAGYGEILPFTNSPVRFTEYMVYERQGLRRTLMKIDGETGSPFMVPPQNMPFSPVPLQPNPKYNWTLSEIPVERLVLRPTTILDIRVEPGHEILPEEMDAAIAEAHWREGDEVLVRTGWGTRERAFTMGLDYFKNTPCIRYDAGLRLAEKMDQMNSSFFMTDCGLVNPPRVQGHNWFRGDKPLSPLPKPWPSAEARERNIDLRGITHASPEPSSYGALIRKAIAGCKCLVDCDAIAGRRCQMIIMPLLIRNGGASPCRFFAVED